MKHRIYVYNTMDDFEDRSPGSYFDIEFKENARLVEFVDAWLGKHPEKPIAILPLG